MILSNYYYFFISWKEWYTLETLIHLIIYVNIFVKINIGSIIYHLLYTTIKWWWQEIHWSFLQFVSHSLTINISQASDPDSLFGKASKVIYAASNPDVGQILAEIKEGKYAFINIDHPMEWTIHRAFSVVRGKLVKL